MDKRTQDFAAEASPAGSRLTIVAHDTVPQFDLADHGAGGASRNWLRFSQLKVEAAIFMLIALTFAAVLGQEAVTSEQLRLTPGSAQYYTYSYGDGGSGGKSTVAMGSKPLTWSCTLRTAIQYPFCGYGLQLDAANSGKARDFSHFQTVALKLNYHGAGDRLRLTLTAKPPEALAAKVQGQTLPMTADFDVVQGANEVRIPMSQLATEPWWVTEHNISPDEARIPLKAVTGINIVSSDQPVFNSQ
ncbi:MAG: hypothetical protein JF615_00965, partial [Asticcacaulis sp.]|nr:hypothetical protein [Asticcacaulis sp.]